MRSHRSCSPPHWNHWTKAVPRSDFQSKKRRERLFWMGRMARHGGRLWLADALRRSVHGVRCPLLTKLFYSLAESKVFQNISGFETKNHCLLCEWGTFGKTKLYERNAKQNTALGTPFGPWPQCITRQFLLLAPFKVWNQHQFLHQREIRVAKIGKIHRTQTWFIQDEQQAAFMAVHQTQRSLTKTLLMSASESCMSCDLVRPGSVCHRFHF